MQMLLHWEYMRIQLVTNRSFHGHDWVNLQARVPRSLERRPTSPHNIWAEKASDISDMHTSSPRHSPVLLYCTIIAPGHFCLRPPMTIEF